VTLALIRDYRALARWRLPPFLFEYIDGGSYAEVTLRRNIVNLEGVACPRLPLGATISYRRAHADH
jgi:L-lactate dehydrogenase (cytochrome)